MPRPKNTPGPAPELFAEILSVAQMARADAHAIASGVAGSKLMEAAGRAVVAAMLSKWKKRRVVVLCGPGNNGGDGFVIARVLKQKGWPVDLYLLGDQAKLKGDAAKMAMRWVKTARGKMIPLDGSFMAELKHSKRPKPIIVDALFGAGLDRPLKAVAKRTVETISRLQAENEIEGIVAVDLPSGLDGDSGEALGDGGGGVSINADLTVTFFRAKPAHVLLPARMLCGEVRVVDIGLADEVINSLGVNTFINSPDCWARDLPWPDENSHKYTRGHVVVAGGEVMTGAARLSALAARRAGAGLVTIAAPISAFGIYAASADPGTLVAPVGDLADFKKLLGDARKNAILIGPGAGVSTETRDLVLAALKSEKACVIDADGLNAFAKSPAQLFKAIKANKSADTVLTPHGGEFARLFPKIAKSAGGKLDHARRAARASGAVVVFKGVDTVIAAPDGRAIIETHSPPQLATAGSGDVLAGLIAGLLGQGQVGGMAGFEAAAAAVWMHAEAAQMFGPGLIAEDISQTLPNVWAGLAKMRP